MPIISIKTVVKRQGNLQAFEMDKLKRSIRAALQTAGIKHNPVDQKVADQALTLIQTDDPEKINTTELRQAVETALYSSGYDEAAKMYLVYRLLPKPALSQMNGQAAVAAEPNGAVTKIAKRDGSIVDFDLAKVVSAIERAGKETGQLDRERAEQLAREVRSRLNHMYANQVPDVEQIQDVVEMTLMRSGFHKTAKAYILYREKHASERKSQRQIPEEFKSLVKDSQKYFKNPLAEFVYYRTYSKWLPEKNRRETWLETVDRYMRFMKENLGQKLTAEEYADVRQGILEMDICPSMRLLWASGPAARKTNVAAYNCSYIAPTRTRDFGEIMYILMCGAGLGFAVEYENVEKFPQIAKQSGEKLPTHVVEDSKEGWADAFIKAMDTWFEGKDIDFDYSQIRPSGARLQTMGGRASGPQPLIDLIDFARKKMMARQGRRLRTIDVHDIICKIGEIVVAGGVRRSALISLSNLDDPHLRDAKKGQFYLTEPQRSMANNSAVYDKKPTADEFLKEWTSLVDSQSGERGIFNRGGLETQVPARRWQTFKDQKQQGTNPCGEIVLRSRQFCNLTSIVVRPDDTEESLKRKMKLATILGTYQATLTHFPYLSKEWHDNCSQEALLGVSLTGYYDNDLIREPEVLERLRDFSVDINKGFAERFGINQATSVTTVKPHGNSSQLLDTASGMHPRYSQYYIRRIRISRNDPLFELLKSEGVPYHPEVGQTEEKATTFVLEFPVKAPDNAITRSDISARDLLNEWKKLKVNFTEHNPSVTIYVGDDEWINVANFIYENWENVGGLSFLPRDNHVYQLAPYEEIDEETYRKLASKIGEIDFSKLALYEYEDHTEGAKEYACVGGACEMK